MLTKTSIGLDVGRSAVKVVACAGGLFYRFAFPSIVCPAISLDDATAELAAPDTVEVLGKRYFTGETARVQGGMGSTVGLSHDWTESDDYLALVASAMKRLAALEAAGLADPYIVIGTPAALFASQAKFLEARTLEVLQAELKVLPQPMGAYCDFLLDQRGLPKPAVLRSESGEPRAWAVVEVGHYTTDFMLMRNGQMVAQRSASCEGIHHGAEHLVRILGAKGVHIDLLPAADALRTKKIRHFGEKAIPDEVDEALDHVVQKILGKATALLSNEAASLDGLLLAGGGAPLIHEALRAKWGHTILLDNPRMSVADGFCRYGMGMLRRRTVNTTTGASTHA